MVSYKNSTWDLLDICLTCVYCSEEVNRYHSHIEQAMEAMTGFQPWNLAGWMEKLASQAEVRNKDQQFRRMPRRGSASRWVVQQADVRATSTGTSSQSRSIIQHWDIASSHRQKLESLFAMIRTVALACDVNCDNIMNTIQDHGQRVACLIRTVHDDLRCVRHKQPRPSFPTLKPWLGVVLLLSRAVLLQAPSAGFKAFHPRCANVSR
jgi:hypothetical protein